MKRVYADTSLGITQNDDFTAPEDFNISLDCNKQNTEEEDFDEGYDSPSGNRF